ncbi:Phage protein [Staphylococcus equorum subsp. equorum]|uniref:DUF3310 domain-containing protein n=1 Tax=Staphylococcus TaxID=1279 RepID=UPI000628D3D8|nr:Phage protein [Staphylococcus equorum subsp. equorum]
MKIRDLDLDQYVIVYDIGKSECSDGMTVVGRVEEIIFNDDGENAATINSLGNLYDITDDNYFDLWTKSIEDKTESINTTVKWNDNGNLEVKDNYEIKVPNDILDNNSDVIGYIKDEINTHRSNDVQQRKRNDKVNHPSHYNYGDIEVIDFIEQVTQHYNPNVAYHIGNAIKYLARSPHKNGKEDVAKAKWYIERAYDNWDVK